MKNKMLTVMMATMATILVASCSKEIDIEADEGSGTTEEKANSTLIVKTRSVSDGTEESTVSYPVQVYVFNNKGTCVATSSIESASSVFSLKLHKGSYNVYAVAGANSDTYELPTQDEATPQSLITLKEGKNHADLMAATQSPVELSDGGTNTLTVALNRKVMLIQSVAMTGLPETVSAVTVTLAPLYEALRLNGEYEGTESSTIALKKNGSGWESPSATYLLPATGTASIAVAVTTGSVTKTYSYTSTDELEANHKINIKGSYDSGELEVEGTISGDVWGEERDIVFDMTDADTTTVVPDEPTTEAPAVGTFCFDGKCFVTASKVNDDNSVTVTLMTAKEKTGLTEGGATQADIKTAVDNAIKELAVEGIDGWRLPTLAEFLEAIELYKQYISNMPSGTQNFVYNNFYMYEKDDGTIATRSGNIQGRDVSVDNKSCLRAFTTKTYK